MVCYRCYCFLWSIKLHVNFSSNGSPERIIKSHICASNVQFLKNRSYDFQDSHSDLPFSVSSFPNSNRSDEAPNICRYQHSSLLGRGGTSSACPQSNTHCMKVNICSSLTESSDKLICRFLAGLSAVNKCIFCQGRSIFTKKMKWYPVSVHVLVNVSFHYKHEFLIFHKQNNLVIILLANTDEPILSHYSAQELCFYIVETLYGVHYQEQMSGIFKFHPSWSNPIVTFGHKVRCSIQFSGQIHDGLYL